MHILGRVPVHVGLHVANVNGSIEQRGEHMLHNIFPLSESTFWSPHLVALQQVRGLRYTVKPMQ